MRKVISIILIAALVWISVASAPPLRAQNASLIGKTVPSWKFGRSSWINTRRTIRWSKLKGRVTVIEFLRINCSHCETAAPSRRILYRKYRPRGLRMIGFQSPGVSPEENDWAKVKSVLRQWKLTYPIAFDDNRTVMKKFGQNTYPAVFVLDRNGIVRFQQNGESREKQAQLDRVVGQMLQARD